MAPARFGRPRTWSADDDERLGGSNHVMRVGKDSEAMDSEGDNEARSTSGLERSQSAPRGDAAAAPADTAPAPSADTAAAPSADTAAAPSADTAAAPSADTAAVPGDTPAASVASAAPADTGAASADTAADTGRPSEQSASAPAQAAPQDSPGPARTPWREHLAGAGISFLGWLSRPRVRLTVTGVILLLVGGLFVTNSVWTLPLVIAGVLMVVVAWIGGRLDGRFAVQWGEAGTQLEFRASIKAAEPPRAALPQTSSSPSRALVHALEREPRDAEIIEGEAHTVEIDVAELKALIAAAELTEAEPAHTEAAARATRNLRVAHGGARSSDTSR
jgi:hypothetical protein